MNATTTATTAPGPQHLRALERANQVRLARAELKRQVASGEITVAEVITGRPPEAESMVIADLLLSQRRWGHTRCRKFLAGIPLSENKQIGTMTERQRRTLVAMLTAGAARSAPAAIPSVSPTPAFPAGRRQLVGAC